MTVAALLEVLTRLEQVDVPVDLTPPRSGDLVWLGATNSALMSGRLANATRPTGPDPGSSRLVASHPPNAQLDRLAALDAISPATPTLREGWVFLVGNLNVGGRRRRFLEPLISMPVQLRPGFDGVGVFAVGDRRATPLVRDPADRARFEALAQFGSGAFDVFDDDPDVLGRLPRLRAWIDEMVAAAGLRISEVLPPSHSPLDHLERHGLVAIVGAALYRDTSTGGPRPWLPAWPSDALEETAVGPICTPAPPVARPAAFVRTGSPLPLSAPQREVVRRSRAERLVAVAGMSGSGKTHTAVAVALDAIQRGENVLVVGATRRGAIELSRRLWESGALPVPFGEPAAGELIIAEMERPTAESALAEMAGARAETAGAEKALNKVYGTLDAFLSGAATTSDSPTTDDDPRSVVPKAFAEGADLAQIRAILDGTEVDGFRAARKRERAERAFRRACGADEHEPFEVVIAAFETAERSQRAQSFRGEGGRVAALWSELEEADDAYRQALSRLLTLEAEARAATPEGRQLLSATVNLLRTGRGPRRLLIEQLGASAPSRATPLWVGSAADVEDLLPLRPCLFDLVIVDASAAVSGLAGLSVLLRGSRAVVLGDPHTARAPAPPLPEDLPTELSSAGLEHLAERFEPGWDSLYDWVQVATETTWLDEQRSAEPAVVEFAAARFYSGNGASALNRPGSSSGEVELRQVNGVRSGEGSGVIESEVDEVLHVVKDLSAAGERGIALLSPSAAQVDAIAERIVSDLDASGLRGLDLVVSDPTSIGDAGFATVVTSLGLVDSDPADLLEAVGDGDVLATLAGRACRRLVVVTALSRPPAGRVGDLFEHLQPSERHPSGGPVDTAVDATEAIADPWIQSLCRELVSAGLPARAGFKIGRWSVDLAFEASDALWFVEATVHPDGSAAHIERHLALTRLGWRPLEALASQWDDDAARAAAELARAVQGTE